MAHPTADTILIAAAKAGDLASLRSALDAGADPNASDAAGNSALKWAAVRGHEQALKVLLDAGADPNVRSQNGWAGWDAAASSSIRDVLKEHGADVQPRRNPSGEPLMPHDWLKLRIDNIPDLERANTRAVTRNWFLKQHPEVEAGAALPFGYAYFSWLSLKEQMYPGDEIWTFDNFHTPAADSLAACAGYCLVRDGEPIAAMITFRS